MAPPPRARGPGSTANNATGNLQEGFMESQRKDREELVKEREAFLALVQRGSAPQAAAAVAIRATIASVRTYRAVARAQLLGPCHAYTGYPKP